MHFWSNQNVDPIHSQIRPSLKNYACQQSIPTAHVQNHSSLRYQLRARIREHANPPLVYILSVNRVGQHHQSPASPPIWILRIQSIAQLNSRQHRKTKVKAKLAIGMV